MHAAVDPKPSLGIHEPEQPPVHSVEENFLTEAIAASVFAMLHDRIKGASAAADW